MNQPFVLLFHRFEELPLAITPLLKHPKSQLVLISANKAITYFPAENAVDLTHLPNGTPLEPEIRIRGQPNVRPKALMAVFHCCQSPARLKKGLNCWYDACHNDQH